MYKESFKKHIFSSTWRISVAHGRIRVILHVTCLNAMINILPSCGINCISGFRCRPSVTTCTCLFIYVLHLFTQGKPKQLTLVFIGALHSVHIVTNMYVHKIIQYSQIART